jgi:hypothetical protein
MQKEIPRTTAIAVILVVVVILAALLGWWYTAGGKKTDEAADLSKQAMEILKRTGGNVQMMTPQEKKIFDEAVSRGLVPAAADTRCASSPQLLWLLPGCIRPAQVVIHQATSEECPVSAKKST